jgi:hypothetical protein
MKAFSPENIQKAQARIPEMSSAAIEALRATAIHRGIVELADACEAELKARPILFDAQTARNSAEMERAVEDFQLYDAVSYAFGRARAPSPEELLVLRMIYELPGISYKEIMKVYRKRDLSLVIGHLVYDRFGCFKKFVKPDQMQTDALFERETTAAGMTYRLRPEVAAALRDSGII